MTIGCWIFIIIGILVGLGGIAFGCFCFADGDPGDGVVSIVICLIIAGICIVSPFIYMKTETGKRALKDQQSNFDAGIERCVKVYDISGNLITEYEGKFDVETTESYVLFDDENNKRHMIYYTTGTIIIDEK